MSGGIFISYRRDDSRQAAGRLADDLVAAFGRQRIFRDIETIEIGVDFTQALEKALGECEVMLVLIGRAWTGITDGNGVRRLTRADDWIRAEIATALQRGIRVVPVLVDGAELPAAAELPEDLQPLLRRQALELADVRWASDVARLVDGLAVLPGLAPALAAAPPPAPLAAPARAQGRSKLAVLAGAAVVLVVGALGIQELMSKPQAQAMSPAEAPSTSRTFLSADTQWAMTFTPWESSEPSVEVLFGQPQSRLAQRGAATWNPRTRTYTLDLKPETPSDATSYCELILADDESHMSGFCQDNGGERYAYRVDARQ